MPTLEAINLQRLLADGVQQAEQLSAVVVRGATLRNRPIDRRRARNLLSGAIERPNPAFVGNRLRTAMPGLGTVESLAREPATWQQNTGAF
jgi:hypothetical protein